MKKDILEQLEFEKSKRDILKQSQLAMRNPVQEQEKINEKSDQKYAWEIELEQYRKNKVRDRFVFLGAVAGFAALVLVISFHFQDFLNIFNEILMKFQ